MSWPSTKPSVCEGVGQRRQVVAVEQQQGRSVALGQQLRQAAELGVGMTDVIEVVLQLQLVAAGDALGHRNGIALGRIGRHRVVRAVRLDADGEQELRRAAVLELGHDLVGHGAVGHVLAVVRRRWPETTIARRSDRSRSP